MNIQQLQAFLKIVEMGSISGAAEMLYISQSTVSDRLKSLEEELDTQLVLRGPGIRSISLSQRGLEFLAFANRMVELETEVQYWRKYEGLQRIRIGAPQSINSYFFRSFYQEELAHPEIKLEISAHWNETIYRMVYVGELDLGLVSRPYHSPNLVTIPLFRETLYVVYDSNVNQYEDLKSMPRHHEIYIDWGPAYLNWYQKHWNLVDLPKVSLDSPQLLMTYLKSPQSWAVVPHCIYTELIDNNPSIKTIERGQDVHRELYLIYPNIPGEPSHQKHLLAFIDRLKTYVKGLAKEGRCMTNLD